MFKKLFFKSLLTVFVLLSGAGKAEGQTRETFPFVQRDSTLYLDVWHPANPRADRAAVVSVFGGGFVIGKRDDSLQSRTASRSCRIKKALSHRHRLREGTSPAHPAHGTF